MPKFKQYLPMFIDHDEDDLEKFYFNDFDDLNKKLKNINYLKDTNEVLCYGDNETLMIIANNKTHINEFHVIGFVEGFDLTKSGLPYYKDKLVNDITCNLCDDDKINDLILLGKKLYKDYEVIAHSPEYFYAINQNSHILLKTHDSYLQSAFCSKFQHFHFPGKLEDIYYYIGLIDKGIEVVKESTTYRHIIYRDRYDSFSEHYESLYASIISENKYKEIKNIVNTYYDNLKCNLINKIKHETNCNNIVKDRDNFEYWFKNSLTNILIFEEALDIHKELPEIFTKII